MSKPIVLCPLDIERRAIVKRVGDRADVRLVGPGPAAMRTALEALVKQRPAMVLLFGLAGGLRDDERAPRINRVVDKDARAWLPTCVPPGESPAVTIVGMDEPVLHRARKKQMASAYAAAAVDTESHVFAEFASTAGWRWGVIRGISDGPEDHLPAAVTEWVDERGRTRILRVLLGAILNPGVIPAAITLFRRSRPALRAAADRLIETLNAEALSPGATMRRPAVVVQTPGGHQAEGSNPIERQLGRRGAHAGDPPKAR